MTALKAPNPLLGELSAALLEERRAESCAIGFTRLAGGSLVLAQFEAAPADAYSERTAVTAVLKPEYVADVASRARRGEFGLVFAHSHPFEIERPQFSRHDDAGELRLAAYLAERLPDVPHLALVVGQGALAARTLGGSAPVLVQEIGSKLLTLCGASAPTNSDAQDEARNKERFDRQIRAFGQEGQARLAGLHVGIVGEGGTGSITTQQLAHLGVERFTLIDFDTVEETNLNRLVGAGRAHVGEPKIEVARRLVEGINPCANVRTVRGDVADDEVARSLLGCDFIFLCTDSHASRAIVSQIAYQYLIPTIDMGVSISVRDGRLAYVTGRIQLLAPGLPCLHCMGWLNGEQIRREMLTPEARAGDPYIIGFHEPQPSVISLNATVASLAVTMFIGVVTEAPIDPRVQFYDGLRGTLRPAAAERDEHCLICSPSGALARGDSWPLPTRI